MPTKIDLIGRRFGRLVVLNELPRRSHNPRIQYLCRCDCGDERAYAGSDLRYGDSKSCGCLRREMLRARNYRHGEAVRKTVLRTSEYRAWQEMKRRCSDPTRRGQENYIGRGITVCERWASYRDFLADMGRRPSPKHSLDRLNVNGNYEPINCRWATTIEQRRNRRESCLDLQGQRFGSLVVLALWEIVRLDTSSTKPRWLCQCECGDNTVVDGGHLVSGHTRSCGCHQRARFRNPTTGQFSPVLKER
jgi:hypothetical protein